MSEIEVAHFFLDPARIEASSAADASALRNLCEQGIAPIWQTLRGE